MRLYWKRLLSLAIIFGVGALLAACAKKPTAEDSCNFIQNGNSQRVSWGAAVPVSVYIDESVDAKLIPAIEDAAKAWNKHYGRDLIRIAGVTRSSGPQRDGANVIYWLKTWEAEKPTEQARTTVYWQGQQINEADIRINAYNFAYFADVPESGKVDLVSLVVHEMGHVLGLSHTDAASVMVKDLPLATARTTTESLSDRREPRPFDLQSLACEY